MLAQGHPRYTAELGLARRVLTLVQMAVATRVSGMQRSWLSLCAAGRAPSLAPPASGFSTSKPVYFQGLEILSLSMAFARTTHACGQEYRSFRGPVYNARPSNLRGWPWVCPCLRSHTLQASARQMDSERKGTSPGSPGQDMAEREQACQGPASLPHPHVRHLGRAAHEPNAACGLFDLACTVFSYR